MQDLTPMEQSMEISKIKLIDTDHASITFSKVEPDGTVGNDDYSNKGRGMHPDFKAALQAFAPHLGVMMLWVTPTPLEKRVVDIDPGKFDNCSVFAVSLKSEGVVISGKCYRRRDGAYIICNTPHEKLSAEHSNYELLVDLNLAVQTLLAEARAYVEGTKAAEVVVQGELELEEAE